MKRSLSFVGVMMVCTGCAFVVEGLPMEFRVKRQTANATTSPIIELFSTDGSSSSSAAASSSLSTEPAPSSTSTAPSSSSSTGVPTRNNNNDFGIGAVAGLGGLTRGVGLGNFLIPSSSQGQGQNNRNDPLSPFGAFAGLNLGNGGRIGAGCQGLSCGVQLGHFVLGTPQLLGLSRNILNPSLAQNRPDGKKLPGEIDFASESQSQLPPNPNPGSPANYYAGNNSDEIRNIFRDAFRGFRDTLASFFRAPITHFIKKDRVFQIDNSTESVVGQVHSVSSASEPKTYRIQLTPVKPSSSSSTTEKEASSERENELD